jgi:divalent metal cation (Fe/Co/Zn/Cd) transporter
LVAPVVLFWLDNVFAIFFAVIIVFTGSKLVRKSLAGLMDEADEFVLKDVVKVLNDNRKPIWIDIHNLRIQQYGSSFHIDCHITLPWYNDLKTTHDELKNIEELITHKFHHQVELFIHPDPCLPFSCNLCQLNNCSVRQNPFAQKIEWTIENILLNEKHKIRE